MAESLTFLEMVLYVNGLQGLAAAAQELKLRYYRLMIELCQHDHKYLATCQHYRALYDTPCVQEDPAQWKDVSLA